MQPLVRAGGIHVAAEVVQVEAHHAGDVRAIDGGDDSFAAGEGAKFFGGQNDSGNGGDVAEEQNARARGNVGAEQIQNLIAIDDRAWAA